MPSEDGKTRANMTQSTTQAQSLSITEARPSDIESLSTILARGFHPTNPYIKRCYPDTPAVRQWWARIFTDLLTNPDCHVLTALRTEPNSPSFPPYAAGVLILRLLSADERGAGFWTAFPMTPDHDVPACTEMINGMVKAREKMMLGKTHFVIEMFSVESAMQRSGVGSRMMKRACEIADEAGSETFVQANHFARRFYERFGFVCRETKTLPGDEGYVECMLVRPVGIKKQIEDLLQQG